MPNPLGQVVPKPTGHRYVISDIHGCYNTLQAIISKISPKDNDIILLLGDYVNKGPDSIKVLDYIIDNESELNLHPLRGNHDQMVLNYLENKDDATKKQLMDNGGSDFLELPEEDALKYGEYLKSLRHYYICGKYILVHAGFNFNLSNPFLGSEDMLNIRDFYYDSSKSQNKTIIHGHVPLPKNEIEEKLESQSKIISLDNGCVYAGEREGMGELLCLNMDTMELIAQPNCD